MYYLLLVFTIEKCIMLLILSWFLYTWIVISSAYLSQPFHIQMNELINEWTMSENGLQKWIITLVPKSPHKGISFFFIVETVPFQIYQQFLIFWPLWSSNKVSWGEATGFSKISATQNSLQSQQQSPDSLGGEKIPFW